MLAVVSAAGLAGFLTSALLLWSGLRNMPVRYGLACLAGYLTFLALVNWWLRRTIGGDLAETLVDTATAVDVPVDLLRVGGRAGKSVADTIFQGGRSGGGGATASFGASPAPMPPPVPLAAAGQDGGRGFSIDLDDDSVKLLPLLAVAAIIVGLAASVSVIWQAPYLLAEIIVDSMVAGAAYGRLREIKRDWAFGVARRTWKPALAIMAAFVLLGWAGDTLKPGADSISDFFR